MLSLWYPLQYKSYRNSCGKNTAGKTNFSPVWWKYGNLKLSSVGGMCTRLFLLQLKLTLKIDKYKHCYMHQMIGWLVNNRSERMYRTVLMAGFEGLFWHLDLRGWGKPWETLIRIASLQTSTGTVKHLSINKVEVNLVTGFLFTIRFRCWMILSLS